jgi:hypothetical protein
MTNNTSQPVKSLFDDVPMRVERMLPANIRVKGSPLAAINSSIDTLEHNIDKLNGLIKIKA